MKEPATLQELRALEAQYERLYAGEADRYDQIRYAPPKGQWRNQEERRLIFELLDLAPGGLVLDAPAGTGRISTYLAEQGLQVVALDLTEAMVREAAAQEAEGILPLVGNGRLLPFPDGSFDGVIAVRFFHLLPTAHHPPFLQELWRVLRPGGTLLAQFYSALSGGLLTWPHELYRRTLGGRKGRYYVWPHQVPTLFAGMGSPTFHSVPPLAERLVARVSPEGAAGLDRWLGEGRGRFVSNRRLFARLQKPPH